MKSVEALPVEVALSAYMDDELTPEQRAHVEAVLLPKPEAQRILRKLKTGSDFGSKVFAALLREPFPFAWAHSIRQAARRKRVG